MAIERRRTAITGMPLGPIRDYLGGLATMLA
jgi:hypothetical protein